MVKFKTVEDTQQEYQQELSKGSINSPSNWLFKKNMEQFDTEFAKQFGFKDAKAARNWREDNHLTVHEGPMVCSLCQETYMMQHLILAIVQKW